MLEKIKSILGLSYEDYILVKDTDNMFFQERLVEAIEAEGYSVIFYKDVEVFRHIFESKIKTGKLKKVLLIIKEDFYLAYDIKKWFSTCNLNYGEIFPRLNRTILSEASNLDWEHITITYDNTYEDYSSADETMKFLKEIIYEKNHLENYLKKLEDDLRKLIEETDNYKKWFQIAYINAKRNLIVGRLGMKKKELFDISDKFHKFIFEDFGKLRGKSTHKGPILVSNVMDYLLRRKEKTAFIVMDGMSISDWLILKRYLNFKGSLNYAFAMIPTVTSISRQSLLGGLLPQEMDRPFLLTRERQQYYRKAEEYFDKSSVEYYRGYDAEPSYSDVFISIIINEVDDLVHRQMYGMEGHITDLKRMGETGKLNDLIEKLLSQDFQVYLGSDHGNKEALGIGRPKSRGIEVETKSQKMMILKDYGEVKNLKDEYSLMEYPGYYLPNDYSYLLCRDEEALVLEGEIIMSHGGMSIEEVIVPFIKIEGEKNNE